MEKTEFKNRVKIEIRYFGVGKIIRFVYENFLLIRIVLFILSCFLLSYRIRFPFFIAALVELLTLWCKFKAPMLDRERREEFEKWVNDSITANGESCHFANVLFDSCYEKMLPDTFSDFLCPIASSTLQGLVPFFVKNLNFKAISFGSKPPKLLQAITEEPPFNNSLSLQLATVLSEDISLEVDFSIFKVPFTFVIKDLVMYTDLRVIIESPEQNIFSNTSVITCMAFTMVNRPVVLSSNIYLNGFNLTRIPMAQYLLSLIFEHFISLILANGECVVWDWIRNNFSLRNISRPESALSNDLFSPIAQKSNLNTKLGRFSLSNDVVARYDQMRKIYWDRTKNAKLKPNEMLLNMSPRNGQDTEPVFSFYEEKKETVDVATQIE